MIVLFVVIGIAVALLFTVIVMVAKEPGPRAADVAIGYVRAVGSGDFDAMYRMIDPELMGGRNRLDWIEAQRQHPHLAFDANGVHAVAVDGGDDEAHVDVAVDADHVVAVELVLRSRVWVVTTYDGRPAVAVG